MHRTYVGVGFLLLLALSGCGRGATDTTVAPGQPGSAAHWPTAGRALWGLFEIAVDSASDESVKVVPLRAGSFHVNIRTLLEDFPCTTCLSITDFEHIPGGFRLDLSIVHPFVSQERFCGFDIRGICFFDATFTFPQLGVRAPSPLEGDAYLANPDGWATLFNPVEFAGDGMLSYTRGKLVPPNMPDPSATLGAFKAYYSEGQSEEDGGRRAFFPGDEVSRTYEIMTPTNGPFRFGYTVDASWEPPVVVPPLSVDDFPSSANCAEPFRLDLEQIGNTIGIDGGGVTIRVLAYDHQGIEGLAECRVEAPGLTDEMVVDDTLEEITPYVAMYECRVPNALGNADPGGEEALVMVGHDDPDPNLGLIPAWGFMVVDVSVDSVSPVVDSIEPDAGYQGSTVETTIYGSGFRSGASVELYRGITSLSGYEVLVRDPFTILATFDLTGPLGLYTVYVENPDGKWGELPGGFRVLRPLSECSDAFHRDTLGTGTIGVLCAPQYDCAFLVEGPYEGMMLATQQTAWGHAVAAVDVDTTTPSEPVVFPDALGHVEWKTMWTADVDEFTGFIFITWVEVANVVEVYGSSGEPVGAVEIGSQVEVRGLDHDGQGGFWVACKDTVVDAIGVYHFIPSGKGSGFEESTKDAFLIYADYGQVQDIAVLPDDCLYVLCTADCGTILSYDISDSPPEPVRAVDHVFPGPLPVAYVGRAGDIEVDQTDPGMARCRIVAYANQAGSSSVAVKLDRELNVLNEITFDGSYQAMAINPDPDVDVHHITLYPEDKVWSNYRLLETPTGW